MGKKSNRIFLISAFDETEQKIIQRNKNISELTNVEIDKIKPTNFIRYVYKWGGNPRISYDKNPYYCVHFKTLKGITNYFDRNIKNITFIKDKFGKPFIYEISATDWNMHIDVVINKKQEDFDRWKRSQESKKLNDAL